MGYMGSSYNIPKAGFYLLKGFPIPSVLDTCAVHWTKRREALHFRGVNRDWSGLEAPWGAWEGLYAICEFFTSSHT